MQAPALQLLGDYEKRVSGKLAGFPPVPNHSRVSAGGNFRDLDIAAEGVDYGFCVCENIDHESWIIQNSWRCKSNVFLDGQPKPFCGI